MAPEELLELNQQKAAGEVEEEEMATYVEPTSEAVLMRGLFRGSMWAQGAVALEDEWLDFGAGSRLRIGEQVFGQCLILFRSGTARAGASFFEAPPPMATRASPRCACAHGARWSAAWLSTTIGCVKKARQFAGICTRWAPRTVSEHCSSNWRRPNQ